MTGEDHQTRLMLFPTAVKHDPDVDRWFDERTGELGLISRRWFEIMRGCGDDVRELLHDGHPTACVGDAAFGYVNVFSSHVNIGFFNGAAIDDPTGLLDGSGKFMRHVKVRPGERVDEETLSQLIQASYREMKQRLAV